MVLSPEAIESKWVRAEVDWATEHRENQIIPLIYRECRPDRLHLLLRNLQYLRFTEDTPRERERVGAELRRVIGNSPASAPAKPPVVSNPSPSIPKELKTIPLIKPVPPPPESNFTNRHGLEMIWCPPGKFLMGSPETEPGREPDETQHEVTLTRGFWISRYHVTQEQWMKLMGKNPSHFTKSGPRAPVEQIAWDEAMTFCSTLGNEPDGLIYTLPTEAQWEYACRAGTRGPYAGRSLNGLGWYSNNSSGKTHPVGEKRANPWGIQDMHGNVWEWCLDFYGDYPTGPQTDPVGPKEAERRVSRGGCWSSYRYSSRSAYRGRLGPGYTPVGRVKEKGFRPVLTLASK